MIKKSGMPLLEVKNLKKYFPVEKGFWRKTVGYIKAVDKVWSEPLMLDTLNLNTPCIPESYSLPITSRIPLEADSPKRNATSSYYTHLQ
ncbi:hypothetical protein ES695_07765 [Candidatus Atribacteria bacterium 1244-E10-H5-B2]|nr:MAG: hypothetical protein ES695_07765 [Candidatus Atribacteria bacterium 1244-E10-H5-B2]